MNKNPKLTTGNKVRLKTFNGSRIDRRIVAIRGDVIQVCSEDEWQRAQREGVQPSCIGFRISDVVAERAA